MSDLIMFQGDSITDATRSRDDDFDTGKGYPTLIKTRLGYTSVRK